MEPLSDSERQEFRKATTCHTCRLAFSSSSDKMHHHDHVTGEYLFTACSRCNLALKPRSCKLTRSQIIHVGENVRAYLVPIIFHNFLAYDGHFILRFFRREYTAYTTRLGETAYADVNVIPLNAERNLQLRIGNLVFTDSCHFLASFDNLVKILKKSGPDNFVHTINHFGNADEYFEKGSYPYDYMTDESKFAETALPPKEAFLISCSTSISLTTSTNERRKFGRCVR